MKLKAKLLTLIGLPFAASMIPAHAAPLISIGDTADIFFRGGVSGQYRSNVFNSPNKQSDYIFVFSPGAEVNIGRNSNANVKIIFREDISWYNKFTGQDSSLSNVFVDGVYNTGPLTSSAGFSFVQSQQNTAGTAGVVGTQGNEVRRNIYNAYLRGQYDISPKTYATGAFEFRHIDYTNNSSFGNSLSNRSVYSTPWNLLYRYSEKLSVGLGYRFRYTDVANNTNAMVNTARNPGDYLDNFVSLSVRGELLPKLDARINVGWQNRHYNAQNLSSDNTISVLSVFDYHFSPKLGFTAGFDRDFGTASIGQSTINTGGFIGANYRFSDFITAGARFSMINTDYQGTTNAGIQRSDDTIRSTASVTYAPNTYLAFSAAYSYVNNDSNVATSSFMGHVVDLSASLRY